MPILLKVVWAVVWESLRYPHRHSTITADGGRVTVQREAARWGSTHLSF